MNFLKGILAFFLIVIIVGGLGYLGYNYLDMNQSGHNISNTTTANSQPTHQTTDSKNAGSHQTGNSVGLNQANIILQNKENLNKSITALSEAVRLMSLDPHAPSSNSNPMNMGNMQIQSPATPVPQSTAPTGSAVSPAQAGNNTIINIYPEGTTNSSTQSHASQPGNMTMQNMGPVYDANKMTQLHDGLYKVSLGMAMLNQLQNQLVNQAENASMNTQDLVQYYTNQYNITTQNKSKLSQAVNLVNEAASLVNMNPYVSSEGLVYDKDRMNQLHQSVFKFAEGVASLNLLQDDFTRQSIILSNTVQSLMNNNALNNQNSHTTASQTLFGGIFDNLSTQTVVNAILVIFVIGLILGILGFILSALKPAGKNERI